MEERQGDPRIYIISGFFFSCIISGGVFLGLYVFLPETQSEYWYPYAGIVLVAIPWAFWLLAYVYRCFRPNTAQIQDRNSSFGAPPQPGATPRAVNATSEESPVNSPNGQRHVHFGAVIVVGCDGNKAAAAGDMGMKNEGREEFHSASSGSNEGETSVGSRESEIPLTQSVSS